VRQRAEDMCRFIAPEDVRGFNTCRWVSLGDVLHESTMLEATKEIVGPILAGTVDYKTYLPHLQQQREEEDEEKEEM
jgi:hypothetical protein